MLDQGFIIDTNYYIQAETGAEALAQYGDITTEALYNYAPGIISAQGAVESTGLNLWNTKALATKIKDDILSEDDWKNYYLAGSLIITLSIYIASIVPRENTFSQLTEAILMVGIIIFGINTHKNNGKSVSNYIAKMTELLVPLTIKFIVFSFVVGFAIGIAEASGLASLFADWALVSLSVTV